MTDSKDKSISGIPQDYQLQSRFGFRLSTLSKMMQSRLESQLAEHGLTRLKWCVLTSVAVEGLHAPSELANNIGITRPAVSRLLKTMIKDKLIDRNLSDDDGRARQITITALGRQKLAACWPLVEASQDHFLNKLSASQRDMLDAVLNDMIAGETDRFDDL